MTEPYLEPDLSRWVCKHCTVSIPAQPFEASMTLCPPVHKCRPRRDRIYPLVKASTLKEKKN